jgi:hypothetical protein
MSRALLDRPIAFHRAFVGLTGSVNAALMLSQALYWSKRTSDPDGWFYKTRDEWEEETGLTRYEQEGARGRLRKLSFWREELRGVPATLHFHLDEDALLAALDSGRESPQQVGGNPAIQLAEKPPTGRGKTAQQEGGKSPNITITETTTETTPETTGESLRVAPDSPGQAAVVDEVKTSRPAPLKATKPARPATFEEWVESLKANPTYAHVDIDGELGKCVEWCRVNRKEATQARFLNWINRVPKPIPDAAVSASEPDPELVAGLAKAGMDAATARRMAIRFPDEAKKQLQWLPKREGVNLPGQFLRKAIEGSYPPPMGADPAPSQRPAVVAPKAPRPISPHWLPGVPEAEARELCNEAAKNLRLHNDPVTDDAVCRDARRIWEQRHKGETPPWVDRRAPVRPASLSSPASN